MKSIHKIISGCFSDLRQEKPLVTEDAKDLRATVIGRKEYHKQRYIRQERGV